MKKFKIHWSYQSSHSYEEGAVVMKAKNAGDAENKFYEKNKPNFDFEKMTGYMAESIEETEEEGWE